MSPAAEAHDAWADQPEPVPARRRQVESWASADDLEMLAGIGRPASADWTVLTLQRDEADEVDPWSSAPRPEAASRPDTRRRPELTLVENEDEAETALGRVRRESRRRSGRADRPGSWTVESPAEQANDRDPLIDPGWSRPAQAPAEPGGRRTVVIRGRGDDRQRALSATNERRRPARRPSDRVGHRPDRVAMWAVGLGLLLILVALLSAGGS